MTRISERVRNIATSATLEINETVTALKAAGVHVYDLGLGEADYPAPAAARRALLSVAADGHSRYTEVAGTLALRRAIARHLNRTLYAQTSGADFLPTYGPDEVIVSAGSKHLQYSSVLALCDEGDEVILPGPHWVSYPDMVRMAGARPVVVPSHAEEGFVPPIDRIAAAITDRTRLIFLNSPNNPTGQVWTREQISDLCDLVLSHDDLMLLSDEIYSQIVFGDCVFRSPVAHSPAMRERTIMTSGLSKAYSMGGWRVGFAAVPDTEVRRALCRIGANTVSSVASIVQDACIPALEDYVRVSEMRLDLAQRARLMDQRLNAMGLPAMTPQGAFYIFADVSSLFGTEVGGSVLTSSHDVARAFLEDAHVACVAGECFGDDSRVRFAFVRNLEELMAACDALEAFVLRHRHAAEAEAAVPTPVPTPIAEPEPAGPAGLVPA